MKNNQIVLQITIKKHKEHLLMDYYSDDYLALRNLFNDLSAKDISKK